jgi:PAS domain S-box-containing protein
MENNYQKYKDLFDTMEIGVLCQDKMGRITEANHAAEKILGLSFEQMRKPDSGPDKWKTVKEDGSPLSASELPAMVALRTGKKIKDVITGIFNRRLNQLRWININAIPVFRKGEKKPFQVYTIFNDITESKKQEEILLLFKSTVDSSSNAIAMATPDGKHFYQNKTFDNLFGVIEADTTENLFADRKIWQQVVEKTQAGQSWTGEVEMFGKNKEKLSVSLRAYAIIDKNGTIVGLVNAHTDITERKTVETALRESEETFRDLAEESPNMIFINQKERIVYANKICEKYTGYTIEEFYDEKFSFLSLIDEEYIGLIKENFKLHLSGKDIPSYEYKLKCKNNSRLDVIINTKLITYHKVPAILGIVTDISELKMAEEQIRLTQFGIDKSMVGIFQVDDAGNIRYVNDHACQSLGYAHDELSNMKIWDIDPNMDKSRWLIHRKRTREQRNSIIETVHKRKDGTTFPVEVAINFIEFRNKKVSFSFVRDITERKLAEKALRDSEERLKLALEGTKAGLWDWNIQTGETTYDERWAEIVGYTLDELNPISIKTWMDLCHPDDLKKSDEILEKHFKGELEFYELEIRMKHKDGHWVWIHDRGKVSQWDEHGNPVRITGTHIDVTERTKAEKALRKSEAHLSNAMKIAKLGHWEYDVINDIFTFNDQFYDIFRTSVRDVGGYTISAARYTELFVHPDDADVVKVETQKAIETNDPGYMRYLEHRIIYADGETGYIAVQFTVIKDNKGHTIAITGINQDISERKKIEEALKKQNEEYQSLNKQYMAQNEELVESLERIQKINEELVKAKEKAEESDRLKTAFLANMSHEIRTPMNGIIGFTDLLKEPELTGAQQENYIQVIQQSGYRMLNIIDELIDIARIEAGQVEIRLQDTCVNYLLDGLYTFFKPETDKKGISLSCQETLTYSDSYMKTDSTKLNQILTNLIKNALKFTRTGSIDFGYTVKDEIIEFYVKDTGIGIPYDLQDKIFDRFRRGDMSDTTEYEGVGLGLSITKAFVEKLGGRIWFESEQDKGSTFFFSLPFKSVKSFREQKKQKTPKIVEAKPRHTVLVVEDEETSYLYLKEILYRNRLKVIRALNGEEAIRFVKENPEIKLVLMDIKMPVLNGLAATRQIKKLRPELPIIIETAYASADERKSSFEMGCDDFISKPINKEILMRLIRKFI